MKMWRPVSVLSCAALALVLSADLAGCRSEAKEPRSGDSAKPSAADPTGGKPMTIKVTSKAFAEGERIPVNYTGEGKDISPPLEWSDAPEETKEFVLICDDPDAPTEEPWVHWVIYRIPAEATGLPEALAPTARLKPGQILQGKNSWSTPNKPVYGYKGPLPPKGHGTHHYLFTLYALDSKMVAEPGEGKKQILDEIKGHVLASGRLTGLYSRD
jgi:Raf kinase inhibitor-like YbhB/YbcL family protein